MNLASITRRWNKFLFEPVRGHSLAAARIYVGLLLVAIICGYWRNFDFWLGPGGIISWQTYRASSPAWWSLIVQWTVGPWKSSAFLIFSLLASFCFAAGLWTRLSGILTYVSMFIFRLRQPGLFVTGQDMLYILMFVLIVSDSGAVLSLDSLMSRRKGRARPVEVFPWWMRLVQLHIAFGYVSAGFNKLVFPVWNHGKAFYAIVQLWNWAGPQIPGVLLHSKPFIGFFSWSVMAIEIGTGLTMLFARSKKVLYPVLLMAAIFHAIMAFTFVFYFQWVMIAHYFLFIDPLDTERAFSVFFGKTRLGNLFVTPNPGLHEESRSRV